MIGLIVTGHGVFPKGILSSLKLIAGEQEKVIGVNFEEGQSSELLRKNLEKAIDDLKCEDILVLADLAGGSPFNVSALISKSRADKNIKVIAGTNLPMLLEVSLLRNDSSIEELIEVAKNSAITGIKEYGQKRVIENYEECDGI